MSIKENLITQIKKRRRKVMQGKEKTVKIIVMLIVLFEICLISSNVKAFSLALTPLPDQNAIQLDWDSPEGNLYKVWQLKPGDIEYQSISTLSVENTTEKTIVLNLYPTDSNGGSSSLWPIGQNVTFTTYDGETLTLPKSANLKQWMEEPNSEDPKGYGRGLLEIIPVSLEKFNINPWQYLKDENGNYKIDIIYMGHWDGNASNYVTETTTAAIEQCVNDGLGVLMRTRCFKPC